MVVEQGGAVDRKPRAHLEVAGDMEILLVELDSGIPFLGTKFVTAAAVDQESTGHFEARRPELTAGDPAREDAVGGVPGQHEDCPLLPGRLRRLVPAFKAAARQPIQEPVQTLSRGIVAQVLPPPRSDVQRHDANDARHRFGRADASQREASRRGEEYVALRNNEDVEVELAQDEGGRPLDRLAKAELHEDHDQREPDSCQSKPRPGQVVDEVAPGNRGIPDHSSVPWLGSPFGEPLGGIAAANPDRHVDGLENEPPQLFEGVLIEFELDPHLKDAGVFAVRWVEGRLLMADDHGADSLDDARKRCLGVERETSAADLGLLIDFNALAVVGVNLRHDVKRSGVSQLQERLADGGFAFVSGNFEDCAIDGGDHGAAFLPGLGERPLRAERVDGELGTCPLRRETYIAFLPLDRLSTCRHVELLLRRSFSALAYCNSPRLISAWTFNC